MNEPKIPDPPVPEEPGGKALEIKPDDKADDGPTIQVNLKYWYARCECWSQWREKELQKLRKFVDKIQKMTFDEVKVDQALDLKMHKGPPAAGFTRPPVLSADLSFHEMKVDGRARVHGFFRDPVFFLVWLDRNHGVFPSGK